MAISISLEQLCNGIDPIKVVGSTTDALGNIGSLESAITGDLAFLGNRKYDALVKDCNASAILVPADYHGSEPKPNQAYIFVENPSYTLALICHQIEMSLFPKPAAGIHPSAVVDPSASIDPSVSVGPFCYIGAKSKIGKGCVIEAGTTIGNSVVIGDETRIESGVRVNAYSVVGKRCHFLPNAVIGADGFGYAPVNGGIEKIPQIGNVVIGDDVDVGANSCIDRARFASTKIGRGTKIDNLVQVGHNCVIGEFCFLCGQAGLAGSTIVGNYVTLAGQAGTAGHITIHDKATVGPQCGVSGDVEAGQTILDSPGIPVALAMRIMACKKKLPDLFKRVTAIEKQLATK